MHNLAKTMRFLLILIGILTGIFIGVSSGMWLLKAEIANTSTKNGAWSYNPHVGSKDASGLTRAAVAVIGFLGLAKEESIYFIANKDDNNDLLSGACSYKVTGMISPDDARWWSITVYDTNTNKLIKNPQNHYSFNGDNIENSQGGSFVFHISANKKAGNWLPIQKDPQFDLTLRMYNPSKTSSEQIATLDLPKISKESCP
tara:strand:- start:8848 stop:9450 length:603 start_codon:yes stop_codon:yes gene_type:complete